MNEAQKTNKLRRPDFFKKYLSGKVIDIGAGNDLVCPWAEKFDKEDGDANGITKFRETKSYDAVHSSHCLEHMFNPRLALHGWWQLVRPGGYLILVVPDEDLYEQGIWPSRFASDHKVTFTLKRGKSWSPVSYNILDVVSELPNVEIISAEIQDKDYDYSLQCKHPEHAIQETPLVYRMLKRLIRHTPVMGSYFNRLIDVRLFRKYGIPIDQTLSDALAQIQVIAHKNQEF